MPIPAAALAVAGEAAGGAAAGGAAAGASGGSMTALLGSLGTSQQGIGQLTGSLNKLGNTSRGLIGRLNPINVIVDSIGAKFDKLTDTFHKLAPVVLETVGLFHPLSLLQFNRALMDLKATFGVIFKPVLQEVTGLIRRFADYLYSLPASFKSVIGSLARTTALAGLVAVLGSAFVALGGAMLVVKAVFGPLVWLFEQFKRTVGGSAAIRAIVDTVEGIFQGLINAVRAAWDRSAGIREMLSRSFDKLGEALRSLFTELRPLLAAGLSAFSIVFGHAIQFVIANLQVMTYGLTVAARAIKAFIAPLTMLLRALGFDLPDLSARKQKSAFGLGWSGASVTDPASLYNKLTEEIARNSRPEDIETMDPQRQTAARLGNIEKLIFGLINGGLGGILTTLPGPLQVQITNAIRGGIVGLGGGLAGL